MLEEEFVNHEVYTPLMVYVAGPMRDRSKPGMVKDQEAVERASAAGKALFLMGHTPFISHTMTESWWDEDFIDKVSYERVVLGVDFDFLRRCDAILMLSGWEDSVGAQDEHKQAKLLDLWVFYSLDEVPALNIEQAKDRQPLMNLNTNVARMQRKRLIFGAFKHGAWRTERDCLGESIHELLDHKNWADLEIAKMSVIRDMDRSKWIGTSAIDGLTK